jgi:hypothetical protein
MIRIRSQTRRWPVECPVIDPGGHRQSCANDFINVRMRIDHPPGWTRRWRARDYGESGTSECMDRAIPPRVRVALHEVRVDARQSHQCKQGGCKARTDRRCWPPQDSGTVHDSGCPGAGCLRLSSTESTIYTEFSECRRHKTDIPAPRDTGEHSASSMLHVERIGYYVRLGHTHFGEPTSLSIPCQIFSTPGLRTS